MLPGGPFSHFYIFNITYGTVYIFLVWFYILHGSGALFYKTEHHSQAKYKKMLKHIKKIKSVRGNIKNIKTRIWGGALGQNLRISGNASWRTIFSFLYF